MLDPRFQPWAQWLLEQSHSVIVTGAYRSPSFQRKLYRRFLAGANPYPVLPPGQSMHEKGLAIDLWGDSDELRRLGRIWEKAGGVWGGEADPIHFEAGPAMLRRSR